jgi:hypothetical protein
MADDAIVISDDDEDDELMLAPVAGPCTYHANFITGHSCVC